MRTPILILCAILAAIGGLALGAMLGVVAIGLVIGAIGAAMVVLVGWGAGKTARAELSD